MQTLSVLIVDDEKLSRRALRVLLERQPDVRIVAEAADGEEALGLIRKHAPDLVLLDVQMPLLGGLELLARLAPAERPHVVFVTAFDQHAIRAFDLHAIDYLVKPFSDARFAQAMERAKVRVRGGNWREAEAMLGRLLAQVQTAIGPATKSAPAAERLVVKADGEMHFIDQKDIRWIEGQGDFVKIHTVRQGVMTRITLQRITDQLDATRFLRIHKSSIVNLAFVRRLKPVMARSLGVELDDGTVLPVGRRYRLDLEKVL